MTRAEVVARFCALQAKVANRVVGYDSANDCFCGQPMRGGQPPEYYASGSFRSDGTALEWIERVVADAIDGLPTMQKGDSP